MFQQMQAMAQKQVIIDIAEWCLCCMLAQFGSFSIPSPRKTGSLENLLAVRKCLLHLVVYCARHSAFSFDV